MPPARRPLAGAVQERLAALARAHELTQPVLEGEEAHLPTTLAGLVQAIVRPFKSTRSVHGQERIAAHGPDVALAPKAVTALALVLHEFATNAAKYGALSSPSGWVTLDWTVENGLLQLSWAEHGGPGMDGPPVHQGFGSRLTQRVVEGQLGGTISSHWKPDGLIINLIAPQERMVAPADQVPPR